MSAKQTRKKRTNINVANSFDLNVLKIFKNLKVNNRFTPKCK